ncbi:MAG: sigma 54-interacting transcriptional regulator [Desulfuromonadaceae bacterium]|nr:sigma 54-interacting transcriptional regulator [Desulfuromonadaceae bacterium]
MTQSKKTISPLIRTSTEAILESISDGVFTVDLQWRITSFNRAAEKITGTPRQEAIGRLCSEVFRCSMCEAECALRKTIRNGKAIIGRSGYIINAEGARIPISVSTAALRDETGTIIGGAETFRDLSEIEALRRELEGSSRVGDLVSHSPLMQHIFEILPAVAASPSTVLITGETGTGKELIARTLHELSPRHKGPFVAVNCGALPDTLLESELFGYKAGAFTGAARDKSGRFTLASGGTLFLDEIGEVSPALQVRLLRVLQEKTFEPLGATRSENSDVRILAATNRDLGDLVKQERFREDLYYRINVIRLELPPLRKRKEDIPLLTNHFIEHFNRLQGRSIRAVSGEVLSLLMAHDWPGNIRELENIIERAFIMCRDEVIHIPHLPPELTRHPETAASGVDIRTARELLETETIRKALQECDYNRLAAAKKLGIHKSTLFRKIAQLDISLPLRDGRSRKKVQ